MEFFSHLAAWVARHADWAGPVAFLLALLESLPIIGLLVPAGTVLLAMGGLIGAGTLEPWEPLIGAVIGAALGDAIGFQVTRAIGPAAVRRVLPRSQRRNYARAILLFRRWGWFAVFFGRFVGPVRAVVPIAAGVCGMRQWSFQTANLASALLWAPVYLLPGYLAGHLAHAMEEGEASLLTPANGIVLLVLLLGIVGVLWWRRKQRRLVDAAALVKPGTPCRK